MLKDQQHYPFIYISALMRTGSTMLSEALTELPQAFIFREPHLGKNSFSRKPGDAAALAPFGVDLAHFDHRYNRAAFFLRRLRRLNWRTDWMVAMFRQAIVEPLAGRGMQVGVKEISHVGWQHYLRHFPELRIVLLGRDPRDLYLSVRDRVTAGTLARLDPLSPERLAAHIKPEFDRQKAMASGREVFAVTYEAICLQPEKLGEVRRFVASPLSTDGRIGQFVSSHPHHLPEYERHGSRVTTRSMGRWRQESNRDALRDANQFYDLMNDYTVFWGFQRDG